MTKFGRVAVERFRPPIAMTLSVHVTAAMANFVDHHPIDREVVPCPEDAQRDAELVHDVLSAMASIDDNLGLTRRLRQPTVDA